MREDPGSFDYLKANESILTFTIFNIDPPAGDHASRDARARRRARPRQTLTWDPSTKGAAGSDGSGTWDITPGSATNWYNGASDVAYSSGSNLIIGNNAATSIGAAGTITLNGSTSAGNITFNAPYDGGAGATAGAYTIAGSSSPTLTFSAASTITDNNTNAATTFASSLAIANSGGLTLAGAGNLTFNSAISGAGSLTLGSGFTGTATLGGANSYSGGTTLTGGTLSFGGASALGAGNVNLAGGTLLYTGSTATLTNGFSSTGGNTTGYAIDVQTAGQTLTLNGANGGVTSNSNLMLNKTGAGTLATAGSTDNSYGNWNVLGGTLVLDKASTGGVHGADQILSVAAGATLQFSGTGQYQIFGGGAVANMNGTMDLNGQTEQVPNFSGGGTVTNSSTTPGVLILTSGGTTFTGVIQDGAAAGGTSLTVSGATFTLTGANTYTGATSVTSGALYIGSGTTGSISGSSAVSTSGTGTVVLNLPGAATFANTIADGGVFNASQVSGATTTFSGVISGGGSFTQSGSGTSIWTGADTFNGAISVASGSLQIGNGTSGAIGSSSGVSISSGATLIFEMPNGSAFGGAIANAGALIAAEIAGATTTFNGVISGAGGFTQSGAGTSVFSVAEAYTGATTLAQGTLDLTGSLASGNLVSMGGSSTLAYAPSVANSTQTLGGLTLNPGGATLSVTAGSTLALGPITQNVGGALNVTGSGTVTTITANAAGSGILGGWATVGGTNWATSAGNGTTAGAISALATYGLNYATATSTTDFDANGQSGTFTNSAVDTLRFNNSAAVTATLNGAYSITNGGILVTSAAGANASTITGGTSLTTGTAQLTINQFNPSGALTIATPITGAIGLATAGSGTTILTAANTYTGATSIGGGMLEIAGAGTIASTGPVAVAAGAVLDFNSSSNNTIAGAISGSGSLTQMGSGTTILTAANTFTGGINVLSGEVEIATTASVSGLGTGPVQIEAGSGATAILNFNGAASFPTFTNAISVSGAGTNILSATSWNPVFSAPLTLNSSNLIIGSNNNAGSFFTFNGGITGSGNITVSIGNQSTGAGNVNNYVVIGGTGLTTSGTITFNNAAYAGGGGAGGSANTGTNQITGPVGSGVTMITQASNTNPLTLSGGLTVNTAGTTLADSGSALFTVSSNVANSAGNLTIQTSAAAANVLISGGVNNIGQIINSGSAGVTTISGPIGSSVTGLVQSGGSTLTLTNADPAFTGPLTVAGGGFNYAPTVAAALNLGGATLGLGASSISAAAGDTLNLGAITRNIGASRELLLDRHNHHHHRQRAG